MAKEQSGSTTIYCSRTVVDAAGSAVGGGVCSNFFSPSIPLAHAYAAPFSAPCNWAPLFGRRRALSATRVHSRRQRTLAKVQRLAGARPSSYSSASSCAASVHHRAQPQARVAPVEPRATTWMLSVSVCRLPGTPPSTAATCLSRLAGAPCLDIIDRSPYSRRDREVFARSGELKQRVAGLAWTA